MPNTIKVCEPVGVLFSGYLMTFWIIGKVNNVLMMEPAHPINRSTSDNIIKDSNTPKTFNEMVRPSLQLNLKWFSLKRKVPNE